MLADPARELPADVSGRLTGAPGLCIATLGPGATNLATGVSVAMLSHAPMIAITGQVQTTVMGTDAFQEVDTTGITIPITKHNYLIQDGDELFRSVAEAFYLAGSARPGPVLIDVPKDILLGQCTPGDAGPPQMEGYRPTLKGHPGQIKRAAAAIKAAERPVIIVARVGEQTGCDQALLKRTPWRQSELRLGRSAGSLILP